MQKIKLPGILRAVGRIRGGVTVSPKKYTAEKETVIMPPPDTVTIAMYEHSCAVCRSTVKKGDYVAVGQIIGDSEEYMSLPVHASVSGKVIEIRDTRLADGSKVPAAVIRSDGRMTPSDSITPPAVTNRTELVRAVRASGLADLGGTGIPTYVKLDIPDDKEIDTLIINAVESEPYITTTCRACTENTRSITAGINILQEIFGIGRTVIAIDDNMPQAAQLLRTAAELDCPHGNNVKVMSFKSRHPQGDERLLVYAVTGRKIPEGAAPQDAGCIVINASDTAFIAEYIKSGRPLTGRTVTVSGSCIENPMNVHAPLGTEIQEIIDFCGGFSEETDKIIAGGPMRGIALPDTKIPLTKGLDALIAMGGDSSRTKPGRDCIRCGRCHTVCPMLLMPVQIAKYAEKGDALSLEKLGAHVCNGCGACSYACPAGIPVAQKMKHAKDILRKAGSDNE